MSQIRCMYRISRCKHCQSKMEGASDSLILQKNNVLEKSNRLIYDKVTSSGPIDLSKVTFTIVIATNLGECLKNGSYMDGFGTLEKSFVSMKEPLNKFAMEGNILGQEETKQILEDLWNKGNGRRFFEIRQTNLRGTMNIRHKPSTEGFEIFRTRERGSKPVTSDNQDVPEVESEFTRGHIVKNGDIIKTYISLNPGLGALNNTKWAMITSKDDFKVPSCQLTFVKNGGKDWIQLGIIGNEVRMVIPVEYDLDPQCIPATFCIIPGILGSGNRYTDLIKFQLKTITANSRTERISYYALDHLVTWLAKLIMEVESDEDGTNIPTQFTFIKRKSSGELFLLLSTRFGWKCGFAVVLCQTAWQQIDIDSPTHESMVTAFGTGLRILPISELAVPCHQERLFSNIEMIASFLFKHILSDLLSQLHAAATVE